MTLNQNSLLALNTMCEQEAHTVSFNITKKSDHLVKLSLNKKIYQLGDVIKGSFDFFAATIPCFQVSVRLELEESIEPSFCNPSRAKKPIIKNTFAEHHELTYSTLHSSFSFQIPIEGAQEFATELVSVRWLLQFEFITGTFSSSKDQINAEPMQWNLPIRVLVPNYPPQTIYKNKSVLIME